MSNSKAKENKNIRALFSVVCLCIIALGLVVYFSMQSGNDNVVDEQTTITVENTTQVQNPVTNVTETKKQTTTQKAETTTVKTTMELMESNTPYKSYYKYPLGEAVVKGYSQELTYDETMGDYRAHAAVDFQGNQGDDVVAINDGLVTKVYADNLYGVVVEIDHGGKLVARYCGLETACVKAGDTVSMNKPIGTLGNVPCESAQEVHLHLETILDGENVNPLDVMGKTE